MTTRDDLVDKATAWDAISAKNAELRTALEAKDAEIERLTVCLSNSEDQFQAKVGEVISQMDCISDLERQLAAETERCARIAELPQFTNIVSVSVSKGPNWTEETGNAELMMSQARRIAAAIRGGAK